MFLEKLTIMQSARVFSLHEKTHRETCVFCAYAPKVTQGSAEPQVIEGIAAMHKDEFDRYTRL